MPKAFKFRLEQLLEYRRLQEDLRKRDFALARREVLDQQEKILREIVEEQETKRQLRELRNRELDMTALRLREQYLNSLDRMILRDYKTLQQKQSNENEKRRDLAEASKGVRVLERLREKKETAWRLELDRAEQKFLDEVAQNMRAREEQA